VRESGSASDELLSLFLGLSPAVAARPDPAVAVRPDPAVDTRPGPAVAPRPGLQAVTTGLVGVSPAEEETIGPSCD